jgi:hypothetical protein
MMDDNKDLFILIGGGMVQVSLLAVADMTRHDTMQIMTIGTPTVRLNQVPSTSF